MNENLENPSKCSFKECRRNKSKEVKGVASTFLVYAIAGQILEIRLPKIEPTKTETKRKHTIQINKKKKQQKQKHCGDNGKESEKWVKIGEKQRKRQPR